MLYHENNNLLRDDMQKSSVRRFIRSRGEKLILELASPRVGERLLDVGCGTGEHLLFFRNQGCSVTGLETSFARIEAAKERLGDRAEIYQGRAEDLPFSDNEFDIVTMIASLEFAEDPKKAISEAIRVSRNRVFMGTWNKYAVMNHCEAVKDFFYSPLGETPINFLGGFKLVYWIRNMLPGVPVDWGSVLLLPFGWYAFLPGLERLIPIRKNPFGAFWGISFSVQASYRTLQDVIGEPLVNSKGRQPLQGIAVGMKREGNHCNSSSS